MSLKKKIVLIAPACVKPPNLKNKTRGKHGKNNVAPTGVAASNDARTHDSMGVQNPHGRRNETIPNHIVYHNRMSGLFPHELASVRGSAGHATNRPPPIKKQTHTCIRTNEISALYMARKNHN